MCSGVLKFLMMVLVITRLNDKGILEMTTTKFINVNNYLKYQGVNITCIKVVDKDLVNMKLEICVVSCIHRYDISFDIQAEELFFAVEYEDEQKMIIGQEIFLKNVPALVYITQKTIKLYLDGRFN